MGETVKIPLICETDGCKNQWEVVNIISGIAMEDLDAFFEDYDGSEPEDICPFCHEPAVAEDPFIE